MDMKPLQQGLRLLMALCVGMFAGCGDLPDEQRGAPPKQESPTATIPDSSSSAESAASPTAPAEPQSHESASERAETQRPEPAWEHAEAKRPKPAGEYAEEAHRAWEPRRNAEASSDSSASSTAAAAAPHMPALPWPPPTPSARLELPASYFSVELKTLGDIDRELVSALTRAGYHERSYYTAPGGFALVTRIERIDDDGRPMPEPGRWAMHAHPVDILEGLLEVMKGLPPGRFRVVVLLTTYEVYSATGAPITRDEALRLLERGGNRLSPELASLPVRGHAVSALIYEYTKRETDEYCRQVRPSSLSPVMHLSRAGLWRDAP